MSYPTLGLEPGGAAVESNRADLVMVAESLSWSSYWWPGLCQLIKLQAVY